MIARPFATHGGHVTLGVDVEQIGGYATGEDAALGREHDAADQAAFGAGHAFPRAGVRPRKAAIGAQVQRTRRVAPEAPHVVAGQPAYTVRIANEGGETAQLRTRHWIITDGDGKVQEVRGEGVVGAQPVLKPGQHFEYTSWCMLPTPHGSMHGTYQMVTDGGDEFDAAIAPFPLALPYSLN